VGRSPVKSLHSRTGLGHLKGKNKAKKLFSSRRKAWRAARSSAARCQPSHTPHGRGLQRPAWAGGCRGGTGRSKAPHAGHPARWGATGAAGPARPLLPWGPWHIPPLRYLPLSPGILPVSELCKGSNSLKIPTEPPRSGPKGATPASCAEQIGVSQLAAMKKWSEGWRGWGTGGAGEGKPCTPPRSLSPSAFTPSWVPSLLTQAVNCLIWSTPFIPDVHLSSQILFSGM